MANITYIEFNGREHAVNIESGSSVMNGAIQNNIPGIDADCGGACSCATCHVYIDEAWREKVGGPSDLEQSLLDFVNNAQANSRLSCQVEVTDDLEGLVLRMPETQG